MRLSLAAAVILPAMLFMPTKGEAQTYPWCAQYGGEHGGTNCGFATYEQCRAALSGNGGFCKENPMYRPGVETPPRPHR